MEKELKNFKINKKFKNSFSLSLKILNVIKNFLKSDNSIKLVNGFSEVFNIPNKIVSLKFKKLIYNKLNYKNGIFSNQINLNFKSFLKELVKSLYLITIILFSKRLNNFSKFDFIINGIEDQRSFERYKKLLLKFKKPLVISKKNFTTDKKKVNFYYDKLFFLPSAIYLSGKKIPILKILLKAFLLTIKSKFNYLYFFNLILFSILKNQKIFELNRGKFFMEDRFYNTCPIRNFYFKEYGGILTSTPQKNILETCICFYIDTDIFFSLGDETYSEKRIKKLEGNVKHTVPVGSFFLEHDWFKKKRDQKIIKKIDLLFMGMNPNDWLYINDTNFHNHEYITREWIKKISKVYPDLSIKIKHHANFTGSEYEKNYFKDTNVKILSHNSINYSYGYMNKSSMIFSFGSTTTLEAISMNKIGYFIDPNGEGKNFYHGLENLKPLRIKSFTQFKKIIEKNLFQRKIKKIKSNSCCLKSNKVSERVFDFFRKFQ